MMIRSTPAAMRPQKRAMFVSGRHRSERNSSKGRDRPHSFLGSGGAVSWAGRLCCSQSSLRSLAKSEHRWQKPSLTATLGHLPGKCPSKLLLQLAGPSLVVRNVCTIYDPRPPSCGSVWVGGHPNYWCTYIWPFVSLH
jgi:hypothetical protein